MKRWLCRASGILGLIGVVVLVLAIAYNPRDVRSDSVGGANASAKPGEPFYLKAIDHDKAKRGAP